MQTGSPQDPALLHALLGKSSCLQLVDRSKIDPWIVLNQNISVQDAIDTFAHRKCHRVALSNDEGVLTSILTQSALVRWVANHDFNTIGPISMVTVSDLQLGSSYVPSEFVKLVFSSPVMFFVGLWCVLMRMSLL
jgi:hypothetical protein